MQKSFDSNIIQILYTYLNEYPGDHQMKISDLRNQLSERYGIIEDSKFLGGLMILKKNKWIDYKSLTNQLAGLAWIEPDGIKVAEDIQAHNMQSNRYKSCPATIEQWTEKYPTYASSILRKELIKKVEDYCIQATPQCRLIVLFGEPRVGKTQALKRLERVLSNRFFSLVVDGQLLNEPSNLDIFAYNLARRMKYGFESWNSYREPHGFLADPQWNEFNRGNGSTAFYKFWSRLQQLYQGRCIVLFDELAYLLDSSKGSDPKLILNFLNEFANSTSNVYLVLAISSNFRNSDNKQFIELINSGFQFKVNHYSEDTTLNVFSAIKDCFQCEDDFLSYCVALCDGHPEIMDIAYAEIVKYATFPSLKERLNSSDFEIFSVQLIDKIHEKLLQLWRSLSKSEQKLIILVSQKGVTNQVPTPIQLIKELNYCTLQDLVELAIRVPEINSDEDINALRNAVYTLVQREWIEWNDLSNRSFRFKLGIFPLWLRRYQFANLKHRRT